MKIDRDAFGKFFNGTPGKEWDDYASRLRNAAAGEVDERGYSLADEFDGVAEGGPLGPPMPAAPAQLLKAQAAQRRRQKEAYSLLTITMEMKTQVDYLRQNHFQNGRAAFLYMQGAMASTINRTEIRTMNRTWERRHFIAQRCWCAATLYSSSPFAYPSNQRRTACSPREPSQNK